MRNFTKSEANEFLSECFHTHPAECPDNGVSLTFSEVHVDRDKFEEELEYFAYEKRIQLSLGLFRYSNNEEGVLTVQVPYTGDE